MRHRINAGKFGSFTPEKQKVELEQLKDRDISEEIEVIFEEDSNFSNDDEALAAMEFYDSPDAMELLGSVAKVSQYLPPCHACN